MTLEEALRVYLAAQPALTALLGASPLRVYPSPLPQAAKLPAVTYSRVSTVPHYTHEGDARLTNKRLQIDVWASSPAERGAVRDAITNALSGFRGWWGDVRIGACRLSNDIDDFESTAQRYRAMQDYIITMEG